jgi:hypothetical protein
MCSTAPRAPPESSGIIPARHRDTPENLIFVKENPAPGLHYSAAR